MLSSTLSFTLYKYHTSLAGVVSIIFGVLIAIRPNTGLVALVWLLGIYAIVFGILYIVGYFQTRSLASSLT